MRFKPEDFEAAFGITHHDYKTKQHHLTWQEICNRAAEAANTTWVPKLNIGDRVAIHKYDTRLTGKVTMLSGMLPGQIKVFIDGNDGALSVYPSECRKLRKVERKFKTGDRVAVYLPQGRRTGKVELAPYMPYIVVELTHKDEDGTKYTKVHRVHPKTCRRLK